MYGVILDFLWYGSGGDTVPVSKLGTLQELDDLSRPVDPTQPEDIWPRSETWPLKHCTVTSARTGAKLDAHICQRVST